MPRVLYCELELHSYKEEICDSFNCTFYPRRATVVRACVPPAYVGSRLTLLLYEQHSDQPIGVAAALLGHGGSL